MKKIFTFCFLAALVTSPIVQAATDSLNIVGSYQCTGYDNHDGAYTGTMSVTLDEAASDFEHNSGAYKFVSKISFAGGSSITSSGYAAAQGNSVAFYFENDDHKDPVALTDRGVEIATITYDQDNTGKFKTSIHAFYFQPDYQRNAKDGKGVGGHGTDICVKN